MKMLTSSNSSIGKSIAVFCVVYAACIFTPISIMIEQSFYGDSFLSVSLLLCDATFILKFCQNLRKTQSVSRAELITSLLCFPSLLVLPLSYGFPSSSRFIVWLSVTRMLKLFQLNTKFVNMKNVFESSGVTLNETLTKAIQVILYTFLYASILACVWFYNSCSNREVCDNFTSLQLEDPFQATWILEDEVISVQSVTSCYFRSLHFVCQTLLTVGYGDIHPINNSEIFLTLYFLVNGK